VRRVHGTAALLATGAEPLINLDRKHNRDRLLLVLVVEVDMAFLFDIAIVVILESEGVILLMGVRAHRLRWSALVHRHDSQPIEQKWGQPVVSAIDYPDAPEPPVLCWLVQVVEPGVLLVYVFKGDFNEHIDLHHLLGRAQLGVLLEFIVEPFPKSSLQVHVNNVDSIFLLVL